MGFELMLTTQPLALKQWNQVTLCFEKAGLFHAVNTDRTTLDEQPAVAYAFETPSRESWPEDFYFSAEPTGVYLCFHAATRTQREVVIKRLTACLEAAGIHGDFEEL